jgi:hypothetical protein
MEMRDVFGAHPAGAPMQVSRRNTHDVIEHTGADVLGRIFPALESKATYLPSALIEESRLWPTTGTLSLVVTVMRIVLGVQPVGAPMQVSRSYISW